MLTGLRRLRLPDIRRGLGRGGGERRRPLLCFCAAFSAAALLAVLFFDGTPWRVFVVAGPMLLIAALAMVAVPRLRRPALLLGFALGAVWCAGYIGLRYMPAVSYHDRNGYMTFVAESYAVGYGDYGAVDGRLLAVDGQGVDFSVRLYLEDGSPGIAPGEVLAFSGRIALANTAVNRGHLARGRYLTVTQKGNMTLMGEGVSNLTQWGAVTARAMGDRAAAWLKGEEAGLLVALLTGDCTRYSRDFNTALMNSGTSHITAVSGQHISILVAFWVALWGRRWGLYTVLPLIVLFSAVTGFSPSVLRAAIMCGLTVVAFLLRREHDTLTALFFALLVLVVINPFSLVSASLALSFASTLGIILFTPMLLAGIRRRMPRGRSIGAKVLNYTYTTTAASIAAMAFTLPLCMVFFSRVSLISALGTLAVLWAATFALVGGLVVLGISFIWQGAAVFLAKWVLYRPLTYMVRTVKLLGSQRWVAASDSLYFLLAALVLLGVLAAARRGKLKAALSLILVVSAFSAFFILTAVENQAYTDLVLHNTGSSAVMLLRTGSSVTAVNTGGLSGGRSAAFVDDTLAAWGIAGLERVVLTSDSYRQAGGLELALDRVEAGAVLLPLGAHLGRTRAPLVRYTASGALEAGGFTLELVQVSDSRYIPWVVSSGFSLMDLCGVQPLAAAAALEGLGGCDILVIDSAYAAAPVTFGHLCAMLRPHWVLLCDDGYTGIRVLEAQTAARVLSLSQYGDISLQQLRK